jgi:hypothetical protein
VGATLLIAGIYLSTYTTTIIINAINAQQVQPFKEIGLFVTIIAVTSIGLAFTQLKKGRLLEAIKKSD